MNFIEIALIVIIAAAVGFALWSIFKKKKGGCSCGCDGCDRACDMAKKK